MKKVVNFQPFFWLANILLGSLLLINIQTADAQAKEEDVMRKKNRLSAGVGYTNALGDFGSSNVNDVESGLAEGGLYWSLHYAIELDKGVLFTIGYASFKYGLDEQTFEDALRTELQQQQQPIQEAKVVSDEYDLNLIKIGLRITESGKSVNVFGEPYFGVASLTTPAIRAEVMPQGFTYPIVSNQSEDQSQFELAYGFDFGVEVEIDEEVSLDFVFGYLAAEEFGLNPVARTTSQGSTNVTVTSGSYKQPYSAIKLGMRFVYKL